jgi:NADH-quinone oxidoreductase subunit L
LITHLPYQVTYSIYLALAAVLLPLGAFLINYWSKPKGKTAGWISTIAILFSCVLAAKVFGMVWNNHIEHGRLLWFTIGETKVYAGILLNNLSALMLLLVPLIALPVHIYSMTYMAKDENKARYFTFLSFFCFSMLALVVADNLILFYGFWELVGFSSYLLIGFWYTKDKAILANKKAFIMNRIGDIGLLSAIMIIFAVYHTFDIDQLFGDTRSLVRLSTLTNGSWMTPNPQHWVVPGISYQLPAVWQYVAFGGLFLAVAAKSAQFPLHTWLPDAMEGPTSVSALIHAATMVAAGVFLLARFYPFFNDNELTVLAGVGCFTAFMAATIALTQNDLKRILAYSTISQLGYMVMAMGIGAYTSSLFHLVTHAFFKCLLFLVAGVVIHAMQHIKDDNHLDLDPQDINIMGGLRKKMPVTFITALVAAAALIGLPLTSGYLSKDGILIQAFEWSDSRSGGWRLIPAAAILTSWLTAFYVTRLIVKVFMGESKLPDRLKIAVSDGGWPYRVPLILLAVCCLFPLFSLNPFLYEYAWLFNGFVQPVILERVDLYHTVIPLGVNLLSVFVIYFSYSIYNGKGAVPFRQNNWLFKFSFKEWYLDQTYFSIVVKPVMALAQGVYWFDRIVIDGFIHLLERLTIVLSKMAEWTDHYIIDGFLNAIVEFVIGIGNFARYFQRGKVQFYLFSMLAVLLLIFIIKILI